ncbi:hypothetical protein AWB81_06909 [Caballeronia arationis]|nr:hypothetical protein AWB81_06909 [Caballeronia arationis]
MRWNALPRSLRDAGSAGAHSGSARDEAPHAPEGVTEKVRGKVVQTPQMCSCLGCGNQRHNTAGWTPSIQERRWFEQYREKVQDAEEDCQQR